ncbi:cadherin-like domain-containing protein, partial [Microcoleus sp. herbarium5]|uniref:cadherin-like domain-containing protein n=1 Tax=Microcoleus sp. herbarium5 TaxID=3055434 RepID=UPI002FD23D02
MVANNSLTAGSSGGEQIITPDLLSVVDPEQGPGGTVYTVTELPDATTGQLFFKGVAVTEPGFTFSQADINSGFVSFKAKLGYKGPAGFGFKVSNGKRDLINQRFSFTVEANFFNFAGTTEPQVIVGSATLDNDIEGSDGGDDITGGNANDTIKGGKGKDTIKGGDDGDNIDAGEDDDDIEAGAGNDTLKAGKGNDKAKGGDGNDDFDGGDDDDDLDGGIGDDTVVGGAGNDLLTGNEGNDTIEGGLGTNTLIGGGGKDIFRYFISRQEVKTVVEADFITDFNVDDDVLEFSNAAFSLNASILTKVDITATSTVGSIGGANFLDFTADITVRSITTLQARFTELGGNGDVPIFCQFIDADTGRLVLVYGVGARFELVASFSLEVRLTVQNFVFTGPPLNIPVGTAGPDNFNFGTFPVPVNFNALAGDDNIVGSNFNDTINGGDGNDTITGGLGLDVLSGGSGADLFVYRTTKEGGDKISDFTVGVDKFEFSASAFGNLTTTNFDGVSGSTPDIT